MTNPLISVIDLDRALGTDRPPLLIDVRWRPSGPPGRAGYLSGHLPGAVFADLDHDLAGPPGAGGRHPLPATEEAQATMRRLGVGEGRPVVVYDDVDSSIAARAWWLLRYLGHDDVRVLDGGYRAWVDAGLPVATGDVPAEPGDFVARPGAMPVLDADGAAAVARDGVLLDARAGERYRGETEPLDPVAGHIPGARSAPTTGNVDEAGRFLTTTALARRFADLGVGSDGTVGVYCGSGVTAAQLVLALAVIDVRAALYVGSWSNWVADPTRPVATGAEPG